VAELRIGDLDGGIRDAGGGRVIDKISPSSAGLIGRSEENREWSNGRLPRFNRSAMKREVS